MESDESKSIRPVCMYSVNEIQIIKRALEELKRYEEQMLCYNRGFKTLDAVRITTTNIDNLDRCIMSLDHLCYYDIE